jgi:hypothetical protein
MMRATDKPVPSILETLLNQDAAEAEAYQEALDLLAAYDGEIRLQSA